MQLSTLPVPVLTPRWYQQEAVDACYAGWAAKPDENLIVVAPTGSGKTVIIGMLAQRHGESNASRILVLTHSPELVAQNHALFVRAFPSIRAGIYAAKLGRKDRRAQVTFALVQSVARNTNAFSDCGMVIIDECHLIPHDGDGYYRKTLKAIRAARGAAGVKIVGLTATPWRLNSGNLLEPYKGTPALFDSIAYDIEMLDLVQEGFLCPAVSKGTKTKLDANKANVHKRGGEFIDSELNTAFNRDDLNASIADEIVAAANEQDRRSILVFCVSVDHSQRMANLLRERGILTETISYHTPTAQRRKTIADFKAYKIRALTSVNVLGTGFDHIGVDLVALARPTASPGLYLQQAGRGMRPCEGKRDFLVLDFAMNVMRHGLLTNVKGVHKRDAKASEAKAPVKECPSCALMVPSGIRICPGCGHEWQIAERQTEKKLQKVSFGGKVMDDAGVWLVPEDTWCECTAGGNGKPSVLLLFYTVTVPEVGKIRATEVYCFDHPSDSWARKKATYDWFKRSGTFAPTSVKEAWDRIEQLPSPALVRVVQSGKYWNVRGVQFKPAPQAQLPQVSNGG